MYIYRANFETFGPISEPVYQSSSLHATVSLVDITFIQHTGDKNFSDHIPLQQCGRTLHRHTHSVHDRRVFLLAAGY